jgi:hypothetical protein
MGSNPEDVSKKLENEVENAKAVEKRSHSRIV